MCDAAGVGIIKAPALCGFGRGEARRHPTQKPSPPTPRRPCRSWPRRVWTALAPAREGATDDSSLPCRFSNFRHRPVHEYLHRRRSVLVCGSIAKLYQASLHALERQEWVS